MAAWSRVRPCCWHDNQTQVRRHIERFSCAEKKYAASRIIWKWVTGNEPLIALIDHSDNNQLNNSLE